MDKYLKKPIPISSDLEQYVKTDFIDSPLVEVKDCDKIKVDMQYPILGFKNAEERCFVRKEVYDMLIEASNKLPEGYSFAIWDAWRPFALQKELFQEYTKEITEEFHLEELSKEERDSFIGNYVANPIPDEILPPAHTTGGAVDLTIINSDSRELEMGCEFDAFSEKTRAGFFESQKAMSIPDWEKIRDNRRLLYNIMIESGFTNLPSEWWHYEYGDKNWSAIVDKPALYKGIFII